MKGRRCAGSCHAEAYAPALVAWCSPFSFLREASDCRGCGTCKENVRQVDARPELVPSVLCTGAPARLLEDAVASTSMNRYFLFVIFFAVILDSMKSTVKYRMAWLAGVQALRSAIG